MPPYASLPITDHDNKTSTQRPMIDHASLRRSARLAQCSVLKDLGIVGNDGKFNESVFEDYADHLQQLLSPDLLKPLMGLKGRAFWNMMTEVSSHLS